MRWSLAFAVFGIGVLIAVGSTVSRSTEPSADSVPQRGLARIAASSVPPAGGGVYSHAVAIPPTARVLHVSGQIGVNEGGGVLDDPDSQLDLAWNNVKQVLKAGGMSVGDLAKVTCFVKEPGTMEQFDRSVARHLGETRPAISVVAVRELRPEHRQFQIEAIAAKVDEKVWRVAAAEPRGKIASQPAALAVHADAGERSRRLGEMYREADRFDRLRREWRSTRELPRPEIEVKPDLEYRDRFAPRYSVPREELRSRNGRLDVVLDVGYSIQRIGRDDVRLRTYNSRLVGPVLRVKAGDILAITLSNNLPPEPAAPHEINGHHGWNTTNLHFHGLHVAPQGTKDKESDNVLIEIAPSSPFDPVKSIQRYEVQIPKDHPAGTFWYHAHKHGSVAAQVSSGMCGALIVERDDDRYNLDSVREIKEASVAEEILVLQETPYLNDMFGAGIGGIEFKTDADAGKMFDPGQWQRLKRYVTVNGVRLPEIHVAPGELRRLRFVASQQRESIALRIERVSQDAGPDFPSLLVLAHDGLPTGHLDELSFHDHVEYLELFPGYRADTLLKVPLSASGEYWLVDDNWYNPKTKIVDNSTGADGSPEPVRWIAKIVVAGSPVKMKLPSEAELLPQRLPDIEPADVGGEQFAFYGVNTDFNPTRYLISENDLARRAEPVTPRNAQSYDPAYPRVLSLGRTERWFVGSRNGARIGVSHPFHIHVNPFLVVRVTEVFPDGSVKDRTADEIKRPTWRDTLAMRQNFTYELLTRYADYSGAFVDHCHILDHEDHGMMELVKIVPPGAPAAAAAPPNKIAASIPDAKGRPAILIFVKGAFCRHCMAQLVKMAAEVAESDVAVAVVSASTVEDLEDFPRVPFTLVADPDHKLFREHRAVDKEPAHATIAFDRAGKEVFRDVGEEPFTDSAAVLKALGMTSRRRTASTSER